MRTRHHQMSFAAWRARTADAKSKRGEDVETRAEYKRRRETNNNQTARMRNRIANKKRAPNHKQENRRGVVRGVV